MDGDACDSTPSEPNSPWIAAMPALIAPRSGSCWYMIRQITPTANAEIASGMNTEILNAVDQTMRSVRTAKTRPTAVTAAGTIRTQSALFLSAVWSRSSVKISS